MQQKDTKTFKGEIFEHNIQKSIESFSDWRALLSSSSGSTWFSLSTTVKETFPNHKTAASIANTLSWSSLLTCTISRASCNSKFFNQTIKLNVWKNKLNLIEWCLPWQLENVQRHQLHWLNNNCSVANNYTLLRLTNLASLIWQWVKLKKRKSRIYRSPT